MKHSLSIASVAVRELLYERVFYILIAFALLSIGLSTLLGQLTYAERAKLTVDFMLAAIQISMMLFSVFMSITMLHRELNLGWIAMALSKPISRTSVLLGKFLGQGVVQGVVTLFMGLITAGFCHISDLEFSALSISQTLFLIFVEACVLSAGTYLFAINFGAITSAIGAVSIFILGHVVEGAADVNPELKTSAVWQMVKSFVPNLQVFNMKAIASYGLTLSQEQMGIATIYGLVCILVFITLACLLFERKDIFT